ncbi:soluble NSF attachment family protein [Chloroflexi bacterium TSY]|nr:soluble NSF attachment family protein [Chloroflexi bacterium TSY]
MYKQLGIVSDEVNLLQQLARTFTQMGRYDDAATKLRTGIARAVEFNLAEYEARCRKTYTFLLGEQGHIEEARQQAQQSIEEYQSLGQPIDVADAQVEWAKAESKAGYFEEAIALLTTALETYRSYNRPRQIAKTKQKLGQVYLHQGDPVQAEKTLTHALTLFEQMDILPEVEKTEGLLASSH